MVLMPGFQSTRLVTEGALEPFFFLYTDDSIQGNPETCKQSSIMLNYEVKNNLSGKLFDLLRIYKELFFLQKKHYQSNLFQTHTSHPLNQLVLKFRPHLKRTGECLSNQVHHYITLF